MLIKKAHAQVLLDLLSKERISSADYPEGVVYQLYLQNLVTTVGAQEYALTYLGKRLAELIQKLIDDETIWPIEKWKDSSQFVDSRVVSALKVAQLNNNRVGPQAVDLLKKRGLVTNQGGKYILNDTAHELLEILNRLDLRLTITYDLWQYIRSLPQGPALSSRIDFDDLLIGHLEAMQLITFSIPEGGVFNFTALGFAVKQLMDVLVGWDQIDIVLDDDIFLLYKRYQEGGVDALSNEEKELLVSLGYLDANTQPTKAFDLLEQILKLYEHKRFNRIRTFDIELIEAYLLDQIDKLWQKHQNTKDVLPTEDALYRQMFLKPLREYKGVISYYGRRLVSDLGPEKKQQILEQFSDLKTVEETFKHFFEQGGKWEAKLMEVLRNMLFSLESFGLITTVMVDGKKAYELTKWGKALLSEQRERGFREIPSEAVKAITIRKSQVVAPHNQWFNRALKAGLVSEVNTTESGKFYEELAYSITRYPFLTVFETLVFKKVPLEGSTVEEVYQSVGKLYKEETDYALGKLEARGFVRILPDGGIMLTNRGKLLAEAIAGARTKQPINPLVVRVVQALSKVGTLYVKEPKTRKVPDNLKEAWKESGLDEETFMDALIVARQSGFVGTNGLTNEGKKLLTLIEKMQKNER